MSNSGLIIDTICYIVILAGANLYFIIGTLLILAIWSVLVEIRLWRKRK